ncbi:ABC transporter permease [Agrilutibacter solisilvae]|uniref:FtsX-like permease family protein n=1 Tax=Agrilutibacter solisilvae TaxID=2763317 RepID=A0A974Y2W9_9GAMM|nr:FtsX-like permease family protein [Lysobacter solisilvae]QSX79608.1 FtsX-like permease family protein [Lysobacter solisilvae]
MDIRPILSALRRHKTAASLIVLEIALSCAILCNAVFLIRTRIELMDRPTGLAENEVVRLQMNKTAAVEGAAALTETDLAALRALPGVKAASASNSIPLGIMGRSLDITLTPEQSPLFEAAYYVGDEQVVDAMGLNLVAGRRFTPSELIDWETLEAPDSEVAIPAAIISRAMAEKLFPGQDPLGKSFLAWGDAPITIVGIVEHLAQAHGHNDPAVYDYSVLLPIKGSFPNYILRAQDPAQRAELLARAVETLHRIDPNRVILRQETVEEMRDAYYEKDREMAWLLAIVCIALLVVTAMGIVGLASFWVQQRTRQIGIRRALGATRGQILRYFQTENFLLASIGIVVGMLLAYAINQLLIGMYELPRLPLTYLPVGAAMLWLLGQLAVLAPARRAAAIPPAVATRSV